MPCFFFILTDKFCFPFEVLIPYFSVHRQSTSELNNVSEHVYMWMGRNVNFRDGVCLKLRKEQWRT